MTINCLGFENDLDSLKSKRRHGSFEYDGQFPLRSRVKNCFDKIVGNKHGVYIIRKKADREVVYIGKSGTIKSNGEFRGQDIPGRILNVKNGDEPAELWYRDLFQEEGALIIEYVILQTNPISPALAEAFLLQSFLNEHHKLPRKNNSF